VDHNFVNWSRTILSRRREKPEYVLINPAEIATPEQLAGRTTDQEMIRILFARRFQWFRGTGIMASAGRRLLAEHANISITFAGEGPDGDAMRQYFAGEPRVQFIHFRPEESLQINLAHHVAVNASLGSEGSSLSVGEAMGAGCAVVATNIGGITNMIIDGYNGLLVSPNAESLYRGLSRVVSDAELRSTLGKRAWQTASEAFSLDAWSRRWHKIILDTASELG
jgi:glycosyltransferase involved in cell wall biosynthesis